jgi:hypothetical protein
MGTISNKDLEQFGIVLNTLINQVKKHEESIRESSDKTFSVILKYNNSIAKNQQQFLAGFNHLQSLVEKTQLSVPSISIDFKKDFEKKVDNALEQMTGSFLKQNKKNSFKKYGIIPIAVVAVFAFFSLIYCLTNNTNQTKIDAIKYRLLIKLSKGTAKKSYIKWDSEASTFSFSELEEKLNKTEGE